MTQQVLARGGDWVAEGMNYEEFSRSGYRFAIRYVVPSIPGKMVTAIEIANAHAAGIDVGFVYETSGTTWQDGRTSGLDDGKAANEAMLSIGAPHGVTVYHAVDSQVTAPELPTVTQWVSGLQDGMPDYTVGVYGQFSVVHAVAMAFPHVKLWQTAAWSKGGIYPALELFQDAQVSIGALTIDTDSLFVPSEEAGLWLAHPITKPPAGGSMDEAIAQAEWRYCDKCKGLFYGPGESASKCPSGGTHDGSKSGNYILTTITGSTPVQ